MVVRQGCYEVETGAGQGRLRIQNLELDPSPGGIPFLDDPELFLGLLQALPARLHVLVGRHQHQGCLIHLLGYLLACQDLLLPGLLPLGRLGRDGVLPPETVEWRK